MAKRPSLIPTLADVARECGVGIMTVSRVMNDQKHVSPAMAERVRAAVAKLGYEPNEAARILKGRRPQTIGLIVPDLADPFFSACAHAIQQLAAKLGYMTLLFACEGDKSTEAKQLSMMKPSNIAGLLIVPSNEDSTDQIRDLRSRGLPVVMFDRTLPGLGAGEVVVENREGSIHAVNHLIAHGHKRILCIGYDSQHNSVAERIAGYEQAMHGAGLKPQFLIVKRGSAIAPRILRQLRSAKAATAVFTLNNVTTTAVLHLLQRENIRIPEDLALIGFDDFEMASLLKVPLTAVRQPASALGRSATHMLLDWIHAGSLPCPHKERVVLQTELVIRQSCGCPSS